MRWLLVAQDGWGLGHVSREIGLARELRRQRPTDDFLFLTYSEASHLIAAEGFASLKLPALRPFKGDHEQLLPPTVQQSLVSAVVDALVDSYRPEGLIVDTFPIGLFGEFAALLQLDCFKFLIAREVRSTPEHWKYRESLPRFHALLAPYAEGEIDLGLPAEAPVHFVGPILVRGRGDLLPREAARRRLGLPAGGRICLVSFGGGGNPDYGRLEDWVLNLAARHPGWHFAVATPPLLQGAEATLAADNAARFSYFPMAECFAAFDAAISTTGSSAYELAFMGVPSILIPSISPQQLEDHQQKAERILAADGGCIVPAYDTAALDAALAAISDPQRLAAMRQNRAALALPEGAGRAAAVIGGLVGPA